MKAVAIEKFGDVSVLKDANLSKPTPSRREVCIRIRAAAFNPVDTKIRKGEFGNVPFPKVLGADCSGVIESIGDSSTEFSIGDEVIAYALGPHSKGTYAEYTVLPAAFVAKKPKNLSFEQAASLPLVGLTAFQALIGSGALQRERSLFVVGGAGGVGSMAIALAKAYKATPIITTAGSEESAAYLMSHLQLPKKHILLYKGLSTDEIEKRALDLLGQRGFATVLDTVGGEMRTLALRLANLQGHVATILPGESLDCSRGSLLFQKSLSLHVIFLGSAAYSPDESAWSVYRSQLKALVQLVEKQELICPQIEVLGSLSAETVQTAHRNLESGHTRGKLVMTVD
jgi:NADPH2:quinone reductase